MRLALAKCQENQLAWGYSGLMAMPTETDAALIRGMYDSGELKLKLNLASSAQPGMTAQQMIAQADGLKAQFEGSDVSVSSIKFFADGVVEGVTAYLLEPYAPEAERDPDFVSRLNYDEEALKTLYDAAIASGYQPHTHSIGDASTRTVLDALEYAQALHPDSDARSTITHLQLVADSDKARMAQLHVIASTQPFWHFKEPDWFEEIDLKNLGEQRSWTEYPVKSLIDAGVLVTFSGDHPVSPIDNPFWAIEASVTRNLNNAGYYGVDDISDAQDPKWLLNPAERISVKQAIEAYTRNTAYQVFRENEVGTLEPGKSADLIVLDRDPLKIDELEIDATTVLANIISGRLAYGALGQ
jgi:predicted amidohydrolase YtcJ